MNQLTEKEYHAHPALSYSKLSKFRQNPREYYRRYIIGIQEETSDALRFGKAFDCYLTESERFKTEWTVKDTKTTKVDGCITQGELSDIQEMQQSFNSFDNWGELYSLFGNHSLGEIFRISEKQVKMFWDNDTKRGMMDFFLNLPNCKIIFDIKTTKESTLDGIIKSFYNFNYFLQYAMYVEGVRKNYNLDFNPKMVFVFISKKTFETFIVVPDSDYLSFAQQEVLLLESEIYRYTRDNLWLVPKPCQTITTPYYAKGSNNE